MPTVINRPESEVKQFFAINLHIFSAIMLIACVLAAFWCFFEYLLGNSPIDPRHDWHYARALKGLAFSVGFGLTSFGSFTLGRRLTR